MSVAESVQHYDAAPARPRVVDEATWQAHDASLLMAAQKSAPYPGGIFIDQGLADKFLAEQLNPDLFQQPERVRASHILIRSEENADA